jgi:hypothetical protein
MVMTDAKVVAWRSASRIAAVCAALASIGTSLAALYSACIWVKKASRKRDAKRRQRRLRHKHDDERGDDCLLSATSFDGQPHNTVADDKLQRRIVEVTSSSSSTKDRRGQDTQLVPRGQGSHISSELLVVPDVANSPMATKRAVNPLSPQHRGK